MCAMGRVQRAWRSNWCCLGVVVVVSTTARAPAQVDGGAQSSSSEPDDAWKERVDVPAGSVNRPEAARRRQSTHPQLRLNHAFPCNARARLSARLWSSACCHLARRRSSKRRNLVPGVWMLLDVPLRDVQLPSCTTISGMRHHLHTWMPDSLAADAAARAAQVCSQR
jgi:hypothetical protein